MTQNLMSPLELLKAVDSLTPGNMLEYYRGYFPVNKNGGKRRLADAALLMDELGLAMLVSRKLGYQNYIYYAIRTKRGTITPQLQRGINKLEKSI